MSDARDGPRAAGRPLVPAELPDPEPGPGQVLDQRPRLRRLPHRPARRRRRAAATRSCRSCPGTRSSAGRRRRRGRRRFALGDRVGVPWLGWTCGDVPLLPQRPREPVRRARASPATTSTAATPSTRSPTRASASRSRTGIRDLQAAPLLCAGLIGYRALRMRGRRRAARHLRLRRRGAHRRAGRAPPGPARVRVHARGRRRQAQAFARALGAEWAGASDERRPSRSTRRSSSRRSARWCPPRSRALGQGRHRRLRRHPHERHPVVPLRAPVGRAGRALGREPHARRTARSSSRWRRRCRCAPRSRRFPLEQANEALERLRAGAVARRRGAPDTVGAVLSLLAHAAPISYRFPLPIWIYVVAGGTAVAASAPAAALAIRREAPVRESRDILPALRRLHLGQIGLALATVLFAWALVGGSRHQRAEQGVLREPDDGARLDRLLGRSRDRLGLRRQRLGRGQPAQLRLAGARRCARAAQCLAGALSGAAWPVAGGRARAGLELGGADLGPGEAAAHPGADGGRHCLFTLAGSALFGVEIWLRNVELFTVVARTFGRFAPFGVKPTRYASARTGRGSAPTATCPRAAAPSS